MEFYSEHYVKVSKKEYSCHICNITIALGNGYWREDGKYEGDFFDRCTCPTCYAARDDCIDKHGENGYDPYSVGDMVVDVFCGQYCEDRGNCTIPQPLRCQKVRDYYEMRMGDKYG